jgi:phosphoserine phosphatase RsbU/P
MEQTVSDRPPESTEELIRLAMLAAWGSGTTCADVHAVLCSGESVFDQHDFQDYRKQLEKQGLLRQVDCAGKTFAITAAGRHSLLLRTRELIEALANRDARIAEMSAEHDRFEYLRTDFLSTISHELRTPLTLIRTSVGLLLAARPEEEMRQRLLRNVKQSTDRMHALVNDLLDLARLRSNQLQLQFTRVDTGELVAGVISMMGLLFEEKRQTLEVSVPTPAPVILADMRRLERVLFNLLSNATKFAPEGTNVVLRVIAEPGSVTMSVQDTGPGIPADVFPRLFDQFYTSRTSASQPSAGTGLGLPIAKGIIEAHNGRMLVESTVGQGSTFSFTLPCVWTQED